MRSPARALPRACSATAVGHAPVARSRVCGQMRGSMQFTGHIHVGEAHVVRAVGAGALPRNLRRRSTARLDRPRVGPARARAARRATRAMRCGISGDGTIASRAMRAGSPRRGRDSRRRTRSSPRRRRRRATGAPSAALRDPCHRAVGIAVDDDDSPSPSSAPACARRPSWRT